ncbi:phosphotriesterase family protein [Flexivirga caeni]|uniref:Phosphotriesterase n=1 Tax=Flexivirga caeni TaxID=2294115 RepID=A0A3M9MGB4_9MICO|nr:phosphotriesterase [Flexivirga caeni]RNI24235.1 phosphotriesterase [Flexivirga caeni]
MNSPIQPTAQTVHGPIPVSELGMTLTHEHLFTDLREAWHPAATPLAAAIANEPVSASNAWLLREDAYCSMDNCQLDDEDAACDELVLFGATGGMTLVENTTGVARNPAALVRVAQRTGVNVIMGSGWSLAHGNDDSYKDRNPDHLAQELVREIIGGVPLADGTRVRPGIIGEIGVGPSFTVSEHVTLIAACRAQCESGLPLLIHLPGWQRRGHEIVDTVIAEGVDPAAVVLCHMDPSGVDHSYQTELAARGVWLEFDMIGMQCNFPGEGRAPSAVDTAQVVARLIEEGLDSQLLLSHDVFLKSMLTRFGGNGYSFVPTIFTRMLKAEGVDARVVARLLTANPESLFTRAGRG